MIGSPQTIYVELDGVCYRYDGKNLEQIPNLSSLTDDGFLVSDLGMSSSRAMTVESDVRYAELMVRKELMESGEFDEPISILTHWKKRKGQHTTQIFFTTLPTRILDQYQNNLSGQDGCVSLFPLYSALYRVIQRGRFAKPVAVLFQHNRFGDLVIGTKNQVYYANRCVSFDSSEEQIQTLWETIQQDIKTAEATYGIQVEKLFFIDWVDSTPYPESDQAKYAVLPLSAEEIPFHDEPVKVSFLNVIRMQNVFSSISPRLDRLSHFSKQIMPLVNLILVLALLALAWANTILSDRMQTQERSITQTRSQIVRIQKQIPLPPAAVNYKGSLSFIQQLETCRKTPTYRTIVNDLSRSWFPKMELESLKMGYDDHAVHLEVYGTVRSSFNEAYQGFHKFLKAIKQKGYTITENRFDTEIQNSRFLLKLDRRIQ